MDLKSAGPRGAVVVGKSAGCPIRGVRAGCYSSREVRGVGELEVSAGRRWSCGGGEVDLLLQARRALRLLPVPVAGETVAVLVSLCWLWKA